AVRNPRPSALRGDFRIIDPIHTMSRQSDRYPSFPLTHDISGLELEKARQMTVAELRRRSATNRAPSPAVSGSTPPSANAYVPVPLLRSMGCALWHKGAPPRIDPDVLREPEAPHQPGAEVGLKGLGPLRVEAEVMTLEPLDPVLFRLQVDVTLPRLPRMG